MRKILSLTVLIILMPYALLFAGLSDGIIAYYPLDGNLVDESGNQNDALGTSISFNSGKIKQAAMFDGISSNIQLDKNTFWSIANNFSVSFWIYPVEPHEIDSESTSGYAGTKGQKYAFNPIWAAGNSDAGFGISVGNNGISVYEHAANYMPALLVWKSPTLIDKWTHVAIIYNNIQPYLYINGQLTKIGIKSLRTNVHMTYIIGTMAYGNFKGLIDNVHIFNRSLSSLEVDNLYNSESQSPVTGCVQILGKPISSSSAMLIQSGEYHQKVELDESGCYMFNQVIQEKPFSIIIRKQVE